MLIIIIFVALILTVFYVMKKFYFAIILLNVLLVGCKPEPEKPTVVTQEVTDITINTAKVVCNVEADGGAEVTERGVCWDTIQNPTIDKNKTNDGNGLGTFTSELSNLASQTTYYVRAYAVNSAGVSYGEEKSFETLVDETEDDEEEIIEPELPTVVTQEASDITINTAKFSYEVVSDGGAEVTERGVCWDTIQNPTIDKNRTNDGNGLGTFTSELSNLASQTTYYVRAYAVNSAGVSYGEEKSFETLVDETEDDEEEIIEPELPTVVTQEASDITINTAKFSYEVVSDGGAEVTERGVCWDTIQNPTIDKNRTNDGNGLGTFTSELSNLAPQTTYYVRAYAVNSVGISYGEEMSFETLVDETEDEVVEPMTITVNGVSFSMISVKGGIFEMGAQNVDPSQPNYDEEAWDRESPVHLVSLSDYYIGETEVTQELWQAVMGYNPSHFEGGQKPVEQVTWNDCKNFIKRLNQLTGMNFRFPTEAEWEFAAKGGNESQGYKYSGSDDIKDVAWYSADGKKTRDVKTKLSNELGIYDMSGNVMEWCGDLYGDYSSNTQTDPTGPSYGTDYIVRGGCCLSAAAYCRVTVRSFFNAGGASYGIGFRLALEL